MTTEIPHRLAQLPGFDTSPDVYETPDLKDTDTTTSTFHTSPRVPSEASDTSEEDDDDEDDGFGVSRRRLYPERARSRFREESRGIETKNVDVSDRVDGKRKGYRVKRRTRGGLDEDETLEQRIARLRREVEECKAEAEAEKEKNGHGVEGEADDCDALAKLLADLHAPSEKRAAKGHRRGGSVFHDAQPTQSARQEDLEGETDEQTLGKISAFDSRLSALETALGISSLDSVTEPDAAMPILPSLTLLDQQLAALTSATSISSLEQATSRIQKLKTEAAHLTQLQRAAAQPRRKHTPVSSEDGGEDDEENDGEAFALLSPEDLQRLQSLYTLLPTLQSLSPTVAPLISRLRSLRVLHATAASAAQDLDSIEERQAQMEKEVKMWRDGLEKVEEAVTQANEANGRNGNFVKGWVEDLEKRVNTLGR